MTAMGRFSKFRAPAIGWPVAPPPPADGEDAPLETVRRLGATVRAPMTPASGTRAPAPVRAPTAPAPAPAPASRYSAANAPDRVAAPPEPVAPVLGRLTAASEPAAIEHDRGSTGYRDRARVRRRLRYLRQTRELAFRDLGGFIFDSRRFGRPREDIVEAKLKGLLAMDRELRALETAIDEGQELMLLHEPGITVCPRCGAIHGSDANFCSGCGLPRGGAPLPLGPRPPLPTTRPPAGEQQTVDMPRRPS